ncbi:hypothetical protein BWI15_28540 [Kribbella sp. ALI-6-A]|uniref:WXG100 family type VII secretion target n=1 Tax=Kribbella sp. ALI-6-A TaxID=1933817 RepID=UPI00097BC5C2|nr:WXG100 family type VII secretion target [Kribbella sp. ALI-6-A]ONI67118.1 hypothetical protein BWI15_28540 [Kribbella sp. ALI-6-A]
MAIGDQMDLVTESAQHAHAMSTTVSSGLQGSATSLAGQVGAVIPARWDMDQSVAFSRAHDKWQAGMAQLVTALDKLGTDTRSAEGDYTNTDMAQATVFNGVEAPAFNGQLA